MPSGQGLRRLVLVDASATRARVRAKAGLQQALGKAAAVAALVLVSW